MSRYRVLRIALLFVATGTAFAQSDERSETLSRILTLRGELKSLEGRLLEPARSDHDKYAEFLKKPGTGVIRLMPRELEISAIRGGGAYYSFARKTHEYGYGNDIALEQNNFSVGFAGADYGAIGIIPEGDIDSVTLEHPVVKTLASIKTPSKIADARVMQRQIGEGGLLNGIPVSRRTGAIVGRTYVVRSVNYDRSDILICFQSVRRDSDGSYILVWKVLKVFDIPSLDREGDRPLAIINLGTEYKVIRIVGAESNEATLNKLASEGWELVGLNNDQAFLRRRK